MCAAMAGRRALFVFGSEESVRDMLNLLPQLAVGVAKGCDWTKTQARAQSALQDQLVNGRTGSLFAGEHDKFRIVNLMLADKRLALENFLKESRLEQAYSLFEDMIARIKKRGVGDSLAPAAPRTVENILRAVQRRLPLSAFRAVLHYIRTRDRRADTWQFYRKRRNDAQRSAKL